MQLQPSRDLRRVAGKLRDMRTAMEEIQRENEAEQWWKQHTMGDRKRGCGIPAKLDKSLNRSEPSTRESHEKENKDDEDECERIRTEAGLACHRISKRYDRLVKFVTSCPRGNYAEFIEFLLMGGGRTENDVGEQFQDDYNSLLIEDFYDEKSDYRKLWNDNLTLGLPGSISTREGRKFVPAETVIRRNPHTLVDERNDRDSWRFSDERLRNIGESLQNQITQLDKVKIKQGIGLAVGGVSKALRELQPAERPKAQNTEDLERYIDIHEEQEEEAREAEELSRLKREAIETCLNATTEHLLKFIKEKPTATYHEWIEDLHPENAHEGALLEGLGKTIDHRFFVEVSDHRRIWNDNLFTFLDPNCSAGRAFVPARARMTTGNGDLVMPVDILSGSIGNDDQRETSVTQQPRNEVNSDHTCVDLIQFD